MSKLFLKLLQLIKILEPAGRWSFHWWQTQSQFHWVSKPGQQEVYPSCVTDVGCLPTCQEIDMDQHCWELHNVPNSSLNFFSSSKFWSHLACGVSLITHSKSISLSFRSPVSRKAYPSYKADVDCLPICQEIDMDHTWRELQNVQTLPWIFFSLSRFWSHLSSAVSVLQSNPMSFNFATR